MKFFGKIFIFSLIFNIILCIPVCQISNSPPEKLEIDETKTINPIIFSDKSYNSINVGNKIILTENTANDLNTVHSGYYDDDEYCPEDFVIPKQEDYQELINKLGSKAYSVLTDENGLNMEKGKYYLTNTKGSDKFGKMLLYIDKDTETLKFEEQTPFNVVIRCMLKIPKTNFVGPFTSRDIDLNEQITIKTNNKYLNGYLWKIDDDILKTETITYTFTKSREHKLEFWGKYINGTDIYLCDIIYVNKKLVSNEQTFSNSKIKIINTNFKMHYSFYLHFEPSNFPIAPRDNGGYYIAITDLNNYLHVLSYDKSDTLIKDFNTTENAYPHDITATDYGFAIYMIDSNNLNHSYLNLYNKEYELINTVQIMNNQKEDNHLVDSNLKKQIIKYNNNGEPVFGMRFMYRPDNGKLVYSRNRIFLIFAHYNYFLDAGGHTGDTVVTFNDYLLDMDFGNNWGASHSLIQSATFDNKNHFWTAALSDAYPEGIQVQYTSKRDLNEYAFDPVNKKYNSRIYSEDNNIAGYIKGYHTGPADGKLGGILYFEKYGLYCLVYAKTPNYSNETLSKNNTNIIFVTSWKFEDNKITDIKTYEIKIFEKTKNVMQLRAGKYGSDYIFIIYAETDSLGHNGYGRINKGTKPKVYVLQVPSMTKIINDQLYDNLLMNTNEDLRTFKDGVLIWGGADTEGNLVIHKIGNPTLTDDDEEEYEIITKNDVEKFRKSEMIANGESNDESSNSNILSGTIILIIAQIFLALEFML